MMKPDSGRKTFPKHLHAFVRRGIYCLAGISGVLLIGTLGIHWIEGFSWIDSFYFTSMIATSQGPPASIFPITSAGKIFTCFLAFISVGSMVTAFGFLFGPFFGRFWHFGIVKLEDEIHSLRKNK